MNHIVLPPRAVAFQVVFYFPDDTRTDAELTAAIQAGVSIAAAILGNAKTTSLTPIPVEVLQQLLTANQSPRG